MRHKTDISSQDLLRELLSKIPTHGNECVTWPLPLDRDGYGHVWIKEIKKIRKVHRVSWLWTFGDIPKGMRVLHKCDNPPCFRPDHLFVGTPKDNSQDMVRKGRSSFGEKNGGAKLTTEEVQEIKNDILKEGMCRGTFFAKKFGVTPNLIFQISRGRVWRHI